jgi:hypothetical protein
MAATVTRMAMSPIPGKPVGNMDKVSALNKINGIEIGPQSRKRYFNLNLSDFHSAQRWQYSLVLLPFPQ